MSEDDDEDKIDLVNVQCSDSEKSEASKDSISSDTSVIQALSFKKSKQWGKKRSKSIKNLFI